MKIMKNLIIRTDNMRITGSLSTATSERLSRFLSCGSEAGSDEQYAGVSI